MLYDDKITTSTFEAVMGGMPRQIFCKFMKFIFTLFQKNQKKLKIFSTM